MNYGIADKQQKIMNSLSLDMPEDSSSGGKIKRLMAEPIIGAVKEPSYMPGGGPEAEAPTIAVPKGYGTDISKLYDQGGKVNVEPGILDKAASYAKNLYSQAKALMTPEDSEAAAFHEKQAMVNEATQAPAPAPAAPAPTGTPAPTDLVHPVPYGSRPGEKLIDTTDMTKPLGQATSPAPAKAMPYSKIYDEGGKVDLDGDGKDDHQSAYLSNGERVLTPEQAAEYEKEHPEVVEKGAPADFGGRVIPNPSGIQPVLDTEIESKKPTDTDRLPESVRGNIDNAPMETPQGNISNPPAADVQPTMGREIVSRSETNGTAPQPYGPPKPPTAEQAEKNITAEAGSNVKQPGYMPGGAESKTPDIKTMLQQRKAEAAMKGDLLGLGAAIIGEKAMEPPTYGGLEAHKGEVTKPGEPIPAKEVGPDEFKTKMEGYRKAYQSALDEFTPEGKERAGNIREAMLNYEREHPYGNPESAHPGVLGKVGHVLGTVGNIAGATTGFGSAIESRIPESMIGRQIQERQAEQLTAEGSKQAQEAATTEATKTETALKKIGVPKELTGDTNVRTSTATGKRERAYQYHDGTIRWVPEGASPLDPAYYQPPRFDMFSGPTPMVGATPATQLPVTPPATGERDAGKVASGTPQYVYGEKPDAEHMPASPAELQSLEASVAGLPSLNAQQRAALAFPPGYAPTVSDVKQRMSAVDKMAQLQRQNDQDKFNDELKSLIFQNQNLLAQAHLEDEKLKHDKLYADNASVADSAYAALTSQEVYNDAMKQWFKKPTYAKDVVLVQNLIDEAKNQTGGFSSLGVDTGLGAMLGGPEGALAGGAVGIVSQALKGPATAALETLKKNGISPEGYQAMQAYFNSIPGRLNFETSVMGVKATAMRMREVMRSLMNTVPAPNTPQDVWKNSYNLYYKPMKNLTDRKVHNLDLPKDYKTPTRESMGYPSAPVERNPRPAGATHTGTSSVDNKEYYLDAQGKKLGPVIKTEE